MSTLRIATVGTGIIVDWFLEAVAAVEGIEFVGAYSRTLDKARSWGEPRGARLFFDDLTRLAECDEVDAVYVASPNAMHMPQAQVFLAADKHVLAEKPLASNAREAREAFEVARQHDVVLMEGLRTIHTPGFAGVRAAMAEIGDVCSATFRFSKVSSRVPALRAGTLTNTFDPRMAGGGLMDIGVYCVAPMVALWGAPQRVLAMGTTFDVRGIGGDERWPYVELAGEALCDYGSFCVNLSWGKVSDNQLASQVQGTQATLLVENLDRMDALQVVRPVASSKYGAYGSGEGVAEARSFPSMPLLRDELADFVAACAGDRATSQRFERISLDGLEVMDQIREQLGVRFPADE